MPTQLPIACSLTATQLPARLAEMAERAGPACAFLAFIVENDHQSVVITVEAPAGADDVLAEWVRAFRASQPTP